MPPPSRRAAPIAAPIAVPIAAGAAVVAFTALVVAHAAWRDSGPLPQAQDRIAAGARAQSARSVAILPLALRGIGMDDVPPPATALPATDPPATPPPPDATPTAWVPATTDASCATPTPPGATATDFPTVTPHPTSRFDGPPALRLVTAAATVTAAIGTYCWVGGCRDTFAYVTPTQPTIVRSPFSARLVLAAADPPTSLSLSVHDVTGIEPLRPNEERTSWRSVPRGAHYALVPQQEQDITIARKPGLYIVHVSAYWSGDGVTAPRGDASYGFLVEVQP